MGCDNMTERCEDCEFIKVEGPKRIGMLEQHKASQELRNDTTNEILTEIKESLSKFIDTVTVDVVSLKEDRAILKDRSNFKIDLNWKVAAVIMTFIYMIAEKFV